MSDAEQGSEEIRLRTTWDFADTLEMLDIMSADVFSTLDQTLTFYWDTYEVDRG